MLTMIWKRDTEGRLIATLLQMPARKITTPVDTRRVSVIGKLRQSHLPLRKRYDPDAKKTRH